MADRYIDFEETQIYGPYAIRKIKAVAVGMQPKLDGALQFLAAELADATAGMAQALGQAQLTDASRRGAVHGKNPLLGDAVDYLVRLRKHLDGHKRGTVDVALFFPEPPSNLKSAPRILLAMGRVASLLSAKDCPVSEAKTWHKEASQLAAALAPAVEHADSARTLRRGQSAELDQARQAWLQVYVAAKCQVEAVLRLSGKLFLLPTVFHDLAVPGDTQLTAPPPEPSDPAAPAAPAAPPAAAKKPPKARSPRRR